MELMAPGENILMNWNYQNVATGDGYGSGTSFAAPLAAGAALWFMTHYPGYSASNLRSIMHDAARDLGTPGFDNTYGYGMVDLPCLMQQTLSCLLGGEEY